MKLSTGWIRPNKFVASRPATKPLRVMAAVHASSRQLPNEFKEEYVDLASKLADAAASITTRYFRNPISIDTKGDGSPVTEADRQCEMIMRDLIMQHAPDHSVFGEEFGHHEGSSKFLWVLDPIDGTKAFITGKPLWGTLIALLYDSQPIVGIIDQPILQERWVGVAGRPSTHNSTPITARPCPALSQSYLYATTPHMFVGKQETSFNRVRDAVKVPLYGCDCYQYGLLASGYCDLVVEASLGVYDYLCHVPIIEGAGGVITDWQGRELRFTPGVTVNTGEVVSAGDAGIHAEALKLLNLNGV